MRRPKIETETEYRRRLAELEAWMVDQSKPQPPQLEQLIQIIVDYEEIHYPI